MTAVNVVVVFYSRYGETEQLALAAGLGAVQAHANIRLRRLQDLADSESIARDARWAENLQRMAMDYIAPRDIDAEWADVILLASCPDSPRETEQYLDGTRKKELNIVLLKDDSASRIESARAQGKQAVETARKAKG